MTSIHPVTRNEAQYIRDRHDQALALYINGLSDFAVARILGGRPAAVRTWRITNKLPINIRIKHHTKLLNKVPIRPWKDPESLFCDTEFLKTMFMEPPRSVKE